MERVIIGVTFFLGVGTVIVGTLAIFRRGRAAGGSLELPGIKLTANSAPALLLLVGAAMMLSGFAWASTERARGEAVVAKENAVLEKDEVVKEAIQLHESYTKQAELTRALVARVPSVINELPSDQRTLVTAPMIQISPRLKAQVTRVPPR